MDIKSQQWQRNHDGSIKNGDEMALQECQNSCISLEDAKRHFARKSVGDTHSTIISLWTRIA